MSDAVLSASPKTQAFLRNLPLFRELAPQEISRIAEGTREVRIRRGDILFQKGDPSRGIYAVVFGQMKLLFITPQGHEKVIEIMGPGQCFGEAVMFTDRPYPVTSQALADSLLLHVSRDVLFEEIDKDPKFARRMIAGLSWRLHQLVHDVESYSLRSATERVIGYMLRHEPDHDGAESTFAVTLPATKSVIASRLNITPEHFSRILHELTQKNLIQVDARNVTILDVDRLRSFEE